MLKIMERKGHIHDHMSHGDENYTYRGNVPEELAKEFLEYIKVKPSRIWHLKGFTSSGKTRMSKEFARKAAEGLRQQYQGRREVHTFYHDIRKIASVDKLRESVVKSLQDFIPGWKSSDHRGNTGELCRAFQVIKNGSDMIYILVFDNLDRLDNQEKRSAVLDFIQDLVIDTENVYLVITSRIMMEFIRIPNMVEPHIIKPMEKEDAKDLLREASGNPENLDKYIDAIVELVFRSPLALMSAGYQMKVRKDWVEFSPNEMVEVLEDSTSLTLGLENVPSEDRICERIKDIVRENFHVLEKLEIAFECPERFEIETLKNALTDIPECELKRSILHVLLRGSLYSVSERSEEETCKSLESAPFLMRILKETFCQMTSKDTFLMELNQILFQSIDDCKVLMTSKAKGLREAELHLLKHQNNHKHCIAPSERKALRMNVITTASEFIEIVMNEKIRRKFEWSCRNKLDELEKEETSGALTRPDHQGVQETCSQDLTVPVMCSSPTKSNLAGNTLPLTTPNKDEGEACLSPTPSTEINIPGLKERNQADARSCPSKNINGNNQQKVSGKEVGKTMNGDREGERKELFKKGSQPSHERKHGKLKSEHCVKNPNLKNNQVFMKENKKVQGKGNPQPAANEDDSKLSAYGTLHVDPGEDRMSSCSQRCDSSGPSDLFLESQHVVEDLKNQVEKSMFLSEQSGPLSLNSRDDRKPVQEDQQPPNSCSDETYSAQPTVPDHRILAYTSHPENSKEKFGKINDGQRADSETHVSEKLSKRAVESEFNWEESSGEEELTSEKISDQPSIQHVMHTVGKEEQKQLNHAGKQQQKRQDNSGRARNARNAARPKHKDRFGQPGHSKSKFMGQQIDTRGQGLLGPAPSAPVNYGFSQGFHNPQTQYFSPHSANGNGYQNKVYFQDNRSQYGQPQGTVQPEKLHPPICQRHFHSSSDSYGQHGAAYGEGYLQPREPPLYQGISYQQYPHQNLSGRFSEARGPPSSQFFESGSSTSSFYYPRGPLPVPYGQLYTPPQSLHTNGFQEYPGIGSDAHQDFRYGGSQRGQRPPYRGGNSSSNHQRY